jgi:hypothetical protein
MNLRPALFPFAPLCPHRPRPGASVQRPARPPHGSGWPLRRSSRPGHRGRDTGQRMA